MFNKAAHPMGDGAMAVYFSLNFSLNLPVEAEVQDYYSYFMDMVRAVLDGNMESSQYEDTMREMYGIDAFQFFTMDKLVQNVVRQVRKNRSVKYLALPL